MGVSETVETSDSTKQDTQLWNTTTARCSELET